MRRQWQLHNKAVDGNIMIEFINTTKQLGFGHISLVANEGRQKTALFTSQNLIAHIRFGASIVTYKDGSQMRAFATLRNNVLNFSRYLSLDFGCRCLPINNLHPILYYLIVTLLSETL